MSTRWFVARDDDGTVSRVVRVHEEADAVRGEYLQRGTWVEDPVVLDVLFDDDWGSPVDAAEGAAVARELGAPD